MDEYDLGEAREDLTSLLADYRDIVTPSEFEQDNEEEEKKE